MRQQMMEIDADFSSSHDELFDKSMNEDDDGLPCCEVACETETRIDTINDGSGSPLTSDTDDDTIGNDKAKTVNEIQNSTSCSVKLIIDLF